MHIVDSEPPRQELNALYAKLAREAKGDEDALAEREEVEREVLCGDVVLYVGIVVGGLCGLWVLVFWGGVCVLPTTTTTHPHPSPTPHQTTTHTQFHSASSSGWGPARARCWTSGPCCDRSCRSWA